MMPTSYAFRLAGTKFSGTPWALLFLCCALSACTACSDQSRTVEPKGKSPQQLARENDFERNRNRVRAESERIEAYIERKGWDMQATQTGLRYQVYQAGPEGPVGSKGDVISLAYDIVLMDGTKCYSATADDPRKFTVGFDHVESGIHEVVTYLRAGDKARVILPSHLAFGLTGDNDKIPPMASVVYHLHVLAIN